MQRIIIAGIFILLAACATAEQPQMPLEKAGLKAYALPGSDRATTPRDVFSAPLPVRVSFSTAWTGGDEEQCNIKLIDYLPDIEEKLKNRGVELTGSDLVLDIDVQLLDLPTRLGTRAFTDYCYLKIEAKLRTPSQQQVAWAPDNPFEADTIFYETENIFFSRPEYVISIFTAYIDSQLDLIVPTVLGQAEWSCGYFTADPEKICQAYFRRLLGEFRQAVGCMKSEKEIQVVRDSYTETNPEFMEWLSTDPDVPEKKPVPPSRDDPDCEKVRSWFM